jgi:ATP-dependent Lhr-like helicase
MVQKIRAKGETTMPLGEHEAGVLQAALARIPEGVGQCGLHVVEQTGGKGVEVRIFSYSGSRFNRLLALLLQDRLGGKVQARYNDFIVKVIHAGKEGAGQRVMSALQDIQKMGKDEIGAALPLPQPDGWKFARALPPPLLYDLSLSDHYHVEEFLEIMGNVLLLIRQNSEPGKQSPEL